MKAKMKRYSSSFPPDLGVWIKENLLTLPTFTRVPWGRGEGALASGAAVGPNSRALPALSIFSFKLAFLLLQLGLSAFSTNGLWWGVRGSQQSMLGKKKWWGCGGPSLLTWPGTEVQWLSFVEKETKNSVLCFAFKISIDFYSLMTGLSALSHLKLAYQKRIFWFFK